MSENNPWKKVGTYVADICLDDGDLIDVDVCLRTEVDAARAAEATQHQQEIAAKDAHIANLEHMVREHGQFGDLFQPGGRFHREAQLEPGSVAVVAGGKWLVARLAAVEAERDRLKAAVSRVADALAASARLGAHEDSPEGNRVITWSDTFARQVESDLRAALSGEGTKP